MYIYCLLNDKKALKKFGLRTWYTKKPFGYRVIHHFLILKNNALNEIYFYYDQKIIF